MSACQLAQVGVIQRGIGRQRHTDAHVGSIEPERFISLRLLQLAWQHFIQSFGIGHTCRLQHSRLGLQALQFSIDKLQALQLRVKQRAKLSRLGVESFGRCLTALLHESCRSMGNSRHN